MCPHLPLCGKRCGCDGRLIVVTELRHLLERSVLYHKLGAVCSSESGDSSVAIVTRWARPRHGQHICLQTAQTGSGAHPACCSTGISDLFWVSGYHYLVLVLRMCGAKPVLPLYAFTVFTGTALLCVFVCVCVCVCVFDNTKLFYCTPARF